MTSTVNAEIVCLLFVLDMTCCIVAVYIFAAGRPSVHEPDPLHRVPGHTRQPSVLPVPEHGAQAPPCRRPLWTGKNKKYGATCVKRYDQIFCYSTNFRSIENLTGIEP